MASIIAVFVCLTSELFYLPVFSANVSSLASNLSFVAENLENFTGNTDLFSLALDEYGEENGNTSKAIRFVLGENVDDNNSSTRQTQPSVVDTTTTTITKREAPPTRSTTPIFETPPVVSTTAITIYETASFFSTPLTPSSEQPTIAVTRSKIFALLELWSRRHKSPESARDVQRGYCPMRCSRGELVSVEDDSTTCDEFQCVRCECRRPACDVYGICCPELSEIPFSLTHDSFFVSPLSDAFVTPLSDTSLKTQITTPASHNTSARGDDLNLASVNPGKRGNSSQLGCEANTASYTFLYVRSCPPDYTDDMDSVNLCQSNVNDDNTTMAIYTRVYDVTTTAVYKNIYCATCNGVTKTAVVPVLIECSSYMSVYTATDPDTFLRLALRADSTCRVMHSPPGNTRFLTCDKFQYREQVTKVPVSNVTTDLGYHHREQVIDRCPAEKDLGEVEQACHSLKDNIFKVYNLNSLRNYQNIFCAICNKVSITEMLHRISKRSAYEGDKVSCDVQFSKPPPPPLMFSLMFNFRWENKDDNPTRTALSNCSIDEWSTLDGTCMPLMCSPGKLLTNRTCTTALTEIRGLSYRLRLLLPRAVPDQCQTTGNLTTGNLTTGNLTHTLTSRLSNLTTDYSLEAGVIFKPHHVTTDQWPACAALMFWADVNLTADFDLHLSRDQLEKKMLDIFLNQPITLELDAGKKIKLNPILWSDFFSPDSHCQDSGLECHSLTYNVRAITELATRPVYIIASRTLTCSYVRFEPPHYQLNTELLTSQPTAQLTLQVNTQRMRFSDVSDLNWLHMDAAGVLHVCVDLLETYTPQTQDVLTATVLAIYYLSLVCSGASVTCCCITLMTYFRFPVLRSAAGYNIMFLSFSLLLAQVLYIALSHTPTTSQLCPTLGISAHVCWLWMFSWTYLCSFHMFRIFTAKTRHVTDRACPQLLQRVIVSLVLPLTTVAAVVAGSYVTSGGARIGYGRYRCYLDSGFLVGVSMVVPLATIIAANFLMFAVTGFKIHAVKKLQDNAHFKRDNRRNFVIYIKLSSLTGVYWAIALVGEAINSDALRCVSVVLNGLQGVFIFVSYICNSRVLRLMTGRGGTEGSTRPSGSSLAGSTKNNVDGSTRNNIEGSTKNNI
ncbi:uncharacterized protein LOC131954205 [Physella acuta]|uniref:uncharacterized protein LOC131954205 n=1 Tax=Physella acuta TaxID=109671 RepID=UPI0027DC2E33|nr:uncharacterized protein LOC131954205 [Physella acuta]